MLLELQRQGVQIFISTHDYMIASYFEVKKQKEDSVIFHSLSHAESKDVIYYDKSKSFDDLKNNVIITAFNNLLNEIYDMGV